MESYEDEEKAIAHKKETKIDVDIDPTVLQGETASAFGTAFTEIPTAEYDSEGKETSAIETKVGKRAADITTKATSDVVRKIKSSDTYNDEYGKSNSKPILRQPDSGAAVLYKNMTAATTGLGVSKYVLTGNSPYKKVGERSRAGGTMQSRGLSGTITSLDRKTDALLGMTPQSGKIIKQVSKMNDRLVELSLPEAPQPVIKGAVKKKLVLEVPPRSN